MTALKNTGSISRVNHSGSFCGLVLAAMLLAPFLAARPAMANDDIFPPSPAAKSFINFDGRGFIINGQRTFLASGSLHYARVPRELWRDRLLRMKRAGFNTVQTYAFWNYHEAREGEWNFSGDHDFDAFLKAVKEVGMYAVVRPGPYVCAEWDSGGYPVWLRFKPDLLVRSDNPAYEAASDDWYDHIMPIIAANQINRGGAVIMVQLENEYKNGWGTDMPNPYFAHLQKKALSLGLEVPYFFSGLHHASDPTAPSSTNKLWTQPFTSAGRTSPWYSTEFWAGWFDLYGPVAPAKLRTIDRAAWKMIAFGGNGFNDYMLHGGSNFESYNSDEDTNSYDYGAAIGQAGDLRPMYYDFKRAVMFAHSFQTVLEDSDNATPEYASSAAGVTVSARKGPAGTLLFLDNSSNAPVSTQIKVGPITYPAKAPITIAAGAIVPVVADFVMDANVRMQWVSRVLGIVDQGKTTTIVIYAPVGETVEAHFITPAGASANSPGKLFVGTGGKEISLVTPAEEGSPQAYEFTCAGRAYRILVETREMADRTWFVEAGGKNFVVSGPKYVGDVTAGGAGLNLDIETPVDDKEATTPTTIFGETAAPTVAVQTSPRKAGAFDAPALSAWQWRSGIAEAAPGFDDSKWLHSETPLQMGADGDPGANAWYRAVVKVPSPGPYTVNFSDVGDWAEVFVNGHPAAATPFKPRLQNAVPATMTLDLAAGDNQIAVFTSHAGRPKLYGYYAAINAIDSKGLMGTVTLSGKGTGGTGRIALDVDRNITGWSMKGGLGNPQTENDSAWQALPAEKEITPASWYRAEFNATPPSGGGAHPIYRLSTAGMSRGFVWLNGHNLGRSPEKLKVDGIYLPECWLAAGKNTIVMFDDEGKSPAGVHLVVEALTSRDDEKLTAKMP